MYYEFEYEPPPADRDPSERDHDDDACDDCGNVLDDCSCSPGVGWVGPEP